MTPFLRRTAWRWAPMASSASLQSVMSRQASQSPCALEAATTPMPWALHWVAAAVVAAPFMAQEPAFALAAPALPAQQPSLADAALALMPFIPHPAPAEGVVADAATAVTPEADIFALHAAAISGVQCAAISALQVADVDAAFALPVAGAW